MTAKQPGKPRGSGRKDLAHTEVVMLKLHRDLKAHVEASAERDYITQAEYIRRLILADWRAQEAGGTHPS